MKVRCGILHSLCLAVLFLLQTVVVQAYTNEQAPKNDQGVTFPDQVQLGNIFVTGDKVQIDASIANGTSVDWVITDYKSQKVDSGTTPVTDGKVTIEPTAATGLGFYLVTVTANNNGASSGVGLTSYAIVPPIDNSKMAGARFGVASHFGKFMTTDLAPLLAKAGVTTVRDSMDWSWIETKPGVFDFTVHNFDTRVADLDKNHINTLFDICFGNKLHYDDPNIMAFCAAPHTQDQYDAFTQLCLAHLKQFGPDIKTMEIWNEYNGSFAAGAADQDRPKYYTAMLKDAYIAIKGERPDVQVIGAALNGFPMPYIQKLFDDGALDYMDGIDVHPYGGDATSVEANIHQLVDLMKKYNNGVAKPIWVTEFGDWDDHTVNRADAAAYMTKMYAMLLDQPEVACAYWYLARDYPTEGFTTMGLVHSDVDPMGKYTPSTNYVSYATLATHLYNAAPKGHEAAIADPRTSVYHFERNGQGIWVCWSNADTTSLVFQTNSTMRQVNIVGVEQVLTPANGQVTVKLDDQPIYLIADKATDVASVSETPRPDKILADAATGFTNQQGQNGWNYYTYTSNGDGSAPYDPTKVEEMNYTVTHGDWGYKWSGPGPWFEIGADETQPAAADGNQQWAVRRWTSTVDGNIRLTGELKRGENGDGVGFKIFVDGQQVYDKLIPPKGDEKIDQTVPVKTGSFVDFAVTPGPGTDASYDSTIFKMTILTAPK